MFFVEFGFCRVDEVNKCMFNGVVGEFGDDFVKLVGDLILGCFEDLRDLFLIGY